MRRFTQVALLGAVAFAFMYFDFPLPFFPPYLKYDPSEVPALIATFALGPLYGPAVEAIKALLISMFRSGTTGGPFGIFMNLLAGVTLVGVAGAYYLFERTRAGAIKSLVFGVLVMTGVMVLANVALTPIRRDPDHVGRYGADVVPGRTGRWRRRRSACSGSRRCARLAWPSPQASIGGWSKATCCPSTNTRTVACPTAWMAVTGVSDCPWSPRNGHASDQVDRT